MASEVYNIFKQTINTQAYWDSGNIKAILVDNTYPASIDIDTHIYYSHVIGYEISGTGYSAGGQTILLPTFFVDNTKNWCRYDASDLVWTNASITARGVILYYDTGVASTSTLIAFIDFLSDGTSTGADFTVQWSVDGVFTVS